MDEDIKLMDKTVFELTVRDGIKIYFGIGLATVLVTAVAQTTLPYLVKLQEKVIEKKEELDQLNLKAVE